MGHIYHVTMADGSLYEVVTGDHHAGRDGRDFRRHLAGIISATAAGAAEASIVRDFAYQGRSADAARRLIVFGGDPPGGR